MEFIPIFGILGVFVFAPAIVFGFIYFSKKGRNEIEVMRYKKEILELEVRKEELRLYSVGEENRKYDRLLEEKIAAEEEKLGRKP
jgi:hypothetical protein